MSSRKRSRWGSSIDNDNNNNNRGGNAGNQQADVVSDQEAVRALLSSAAAASASSQPQQQKGRGDRAGGGRGSGPRQERRSGDSGGGADGHYGPQRGEGRNDYKNVNNDCAMPQDSKRSRWSSSDRPAPDRGDDRASRPDGNRNDDSTAAAADSAEAPPVVNKEKPNFGLSGALAKKDAGGGGSNMYKGVLLKFREPPEARAPANTYWRLYVFKGKEELETLHIAKQSAYLIGRNADICDIVIQHPSAR
jgi:smad nuclear-interacting protein 1